MGANVTNPVRLKVEKFLYKKGYAYQLDKPSSYVRYDGYGREGYFRPNGNPVVARKVLKFVGVRLMKDDDIRDLIKLLSKEVKGLYLSNPESISGKNHRHSGLRLTYNNPNYRGK